MRSTPHLLLTVAFCLLVGSSLQACCSDACFDTVKGVGNGETLKKIDLDTKTEFKADQICGNVFKAKGSCCDQTQLNKFADKMLGRLKNTFTAIESATLAAPSVLKAFNKLVELFSEKNPNGGSSDDLFLTSIGGQEQYYKIQSMIDRISPLANDMVTLINDKKIDYKACYDTLFKNKVSSLCMICAGDASSFFDEGTQKFNIKKNFCDGLVTSCGSTLDLFNKVNHLMEVTRVIKNALETTAVKTVDSSFSESRLNAISSCSDDPTSCKADAPKLLSFCREIGVVKDMNLVKSSEGKLSDAQDLKTQAAAGFTTAMTNEVTKINKAIAAKTTISNDFDSSKADSVPAKANSVVSQATGSLQAANQAMVAAMNAVGTATAANKPAVLTDRRSKLDALITERGLFYTNLKDVVDKFLTYFQADLASSPAFDSDTNKSNAAIKLQKAIAAAQASLATFKTDKATYDPVETASTAQNPISKTVVDEFWRKFDASNQVESDIRQQFNTLKPDIEGYVSKKKAAVAAEITKYETNKDSSTIKNAQVPFQANIDTKTEEVANLEVKRITAAITKAMNDNFAGMLTNPPLVAELQKIKDAVTQDALNIQKTTTRIQSIIALTTTNPAEARTEASEAAVIIQTTISEIDIKLTEIAEKKTAGDTTVKNFDFLIGGITSEMDDTTADKNNAKADFDTINTALNTMRAALQVTMKSMMDKRKEVDASMIIVNNKRAAVMGIQKKKAEAAADIDIQKTEAQKSLQYLNTQKSSLCTDTGAAGYDATYCSGLNTKITAATTSVATLTAQATTSDSTFNTQLTTPKAELTTAETDLATKSTALKTLQDQVKSKDDAIKVKLDDFKDADQIVKQKDGDISLLKDYLKMETANKQTYIGQTGNTWIDQLNTQETNLKAVKDKLSLAVTTLQDLASSNESNSPAASFQTSLTAKIADLATIKTNLDAQKTTVDTTKTKISTGLQAEKAKAETAVAAANAQQTTFETNINTKKSEIQSLQAQKDAAGPPPVVRRLQAVESDEDFTMNENSGADIPNNYAPGVTIDSSLSSTASFSDSATSPSGSGNSGAILYLSMIFMATYVTILA